MVFRYGIPEIFYHRILRLTEGLSQILPIKSSNRLKPTGIPLRELARKKKVAWPLTNVRLVVDKSEYKLFLYTGDIYLKTYPIALGWQPVGEKRQEGDGRTPEGLYYVVQKAEHPRLKYLGSRWLRLSYPNQKDAKRGLRSGLINRQEYNQIVRAIKQKKIPPQDTSLGGGIGIHGGGYRKFGQLVRNWTAGCIALFNADIEEFYDFIKIGTPVLIHE